MIQFVSRLHRSKSNMQGTKNKTKRCKLMLVFEKYCCKSSALVLERKKIHDFYIFCVDSTWLRLLFNNVLCVCDVCCVCWCVCVCDVCVCWGVCVICVFVGVYVKNFFRGITTSFKICLVLKLRKNHIFQYFGSRKIAKWLEIASQPPKKTQKLCRVVATCLKNFKKIQKIVFKTRHFT